MGNDHPDSGGETDLAGVGKVSDLLSFSEEPSFFLFTGREELLALDDIRVFFTGTLLRSRYREEESMSCSLFYRGRII